MDLLSASQVKPEPRVHTLSSLDQSLRVTAVLCTVRVMGTYHGNFQRNSDFGLRKSILRDGIKIALSTENLHHHTIYSFIVLTSIGKENIYCLFDF